VVRAGAGHDRQVSPAAQTPVSSSQRRMLVVLFVVYLVLMAWIILWKLEIPYVGAAASLARPVKLVPYVFDLTDVIDNSVGGLIGFGVLVLARRRLGERAGSIITRICLIGGIVAVLAVAAFIASPLRFVGQQDVVIPRPELTRSP
jgi:glycopeptide antibiotics resistance protein